MAEVSKTRKIVSYVIWIIFFMFVLFWMNYLKWQPINLFWFINIPDNTPDYLVQHELNHTIFNKMNNKEREYFYFFIENYGTNNQRWKDMYSKISKNNWKLSKVWIFPTFIHCKNKNQCNKNEYKEYMIDSFLDSKKYTAIKFIDKYIVDKYIFNELFAYYFQSNTDELYAFQVYLNQKNFE